MLLHEVFNIQLKQKLTGMFYFASPKLVAITKSVILQFLQASQAKNNDSIFGGGGFFHSIIENEKNCYELLSIKVTRIHELFACLPNSRWKTSKFMKNTVKINLDLKVCGGSFQTLYSSRYACLNP